MEHIGGGKPAGQSGLFVLFRTYYSYSDDTAAELDFEDFCLLVCFTLYGSIAFWFAAVGGN